MFPFIIHIDQVLEVIKDNDNFSVNQKDDYIVIDYILNTPDLFNNPIEKECRGIIFDATTGALLARRLHKFFNLNERPESSIDAVDLSEPHVILEKLDGSMITPFMSNGKLTWGSKAGITFLTPQIEEFVSKNSLYHHFANIWTEFGFTPIFEWCSRNNRIVIDYPEDRLVLIAMRKNDNGSYFPYEDLVASASTFLIDVVEEYVGNARNMQELSDNIKGMQGLEGFVVRFNDGRMVKIKADEYVRHHRAKDDLAREKNVVSILVNGQADDFKGLLSEIDLARFEAFEVDFFKAIEQSVEEYEKIWNQNVGVSRKDFAIKSQAWFNSQMRALVFTFFDDEEIQKDKVKEEIVNMIKRNTGSATNLERARALFGDIHWENY